MSDPQPEATTTAARVLSEAEIAWMRRDHVPFANPHEGQWCQMDEEDVPCTTVRWIATVDAAHPRVGEAEQGAGDLAGVLMAEREAAAWMLQSAHNARKWAEERASYWRWLGACGIQGRNAAIEKLTETLEERNAECTAREAAEQARDEWRARWNLENVARQDAVARGFDFRRELAAERQARERAEQLHAAAQQHIQVSERYLGQEVEKERQRAERAEQERDDLKHRICEADSDRAVAWQIAQDRGQRAERAEAEASEWEGKWDKALTALETAEAALATEREAFRAAAFDVFPALDSGTGELIPDWLHRLCRGCGRDWISDTEHVQTCWVKAFIERWSTDTAPQAAPHEQGEQP